MGGPIPRRISSVRERCLPGVEDTSPASLWQNERMTAKNSKTWLLVVFFPVSELISLPAVGAEKKVATGLIYGIVTYQDRKPVKGATVYATPLGRPIGAIIPHADSDETGYYAIRIPVSWFGRFAVTAKKEDEDYPNMSWQFIAMASSRRSHCPPAILKPTS